MRPVLDLSLWQDAELEDVDGEAVTVRSEALATLRVVDEPFGEAEPEPFEGVDAGEGEAA